MELTAGRITDSAIHHGLF